MLPFGTRVRVHHAPELIPACVLSRTENVSEEYLIVWPSGQHDRVLRQYMTVIESAAEAALREIGRMLDLPPDAEPAAIVEALRSCVAAPSTGPFGVTLAKEGRVIGRSTREAPPAPAEETVWGEP